MPRFFHHRCRFDDPLPLRAALLAGCSRCSPARLVVEDAPVVPHCDTAEGHLRPGHVNRPAVASIVLPRVLRPAHCGSLPLRADRRSRPVPPEPVTGSGAPTHTAYARAAGRLQNVTFHPPVAALDPFVPVE